MARQLAQVPFENLERLDMRARHGFDGDSMRAFVQGRFEHLTYLKLDGDIMDADAAACLAGSGRAFPQLRELHLGYGISEAGAAAMRNHTFDKLEILKLAIVA